MLNELFEKYPQIEKWAPVVTNYFGILLDNEPALSNHQQLLGIYSFLKKQTIKNQGSGLENAVARIYALLGYKNIQQNVKLDITIDNQQLSSQIDIVYDSNKNCDSFDGDIRNISNNKTQKSYVECKYKQKDNVTLADVAKFGEVLRLHKIPVSQGEIVTNRDFDVRSKEYAKRVQLKLIDGEKLDELAKQSQASLKKFQYWFNVVASSQDKSFIDIFNSFLGDALSVEQQIKLYSK